MLTVLQGNPFVELSEVYERAQEYKRTRPVRTGLAPLPPSTKPRRTLDRAKLKAKRKQARKSRKRNRR